MVLPSPVGESVAANLIEETLLDAFNSVQEGFCFPSVHQWKLNLAF